MQQGIEIPESVAEEILSKLPVKSLSRFKCVCKYWASSFQTSYFITKHLHNNVKGNRINLLNKGGHGGETPPVNAADFSILSTEEGQNFIVKENICLPFFVDSDLPPKVYLPFLVGSDLPAKVYGPCNGLFCLTDYFKIAIWNPSTREFKPIPIPTPTPLPPFAKCEFGFGFDSTNDDYKVVRFATYFDRNNRGNMNHVKLYSFKSNSWKEISAPPEAHPRANFYRFTHTYVNGFYYWEAFDWSSDEKKLILSFDIANEKFSILPCPIYSGEGTSYLLLFEFNGLLGAIVYPLVMSENPMDLFVFNGSSWTRQFIIEPDSVPDVVRPLGVWKNGETILECFNYELVLFDPVTRKVKNLGIDVDRRHGMQLIAYVESLVQINGRSEQEEHITRQSLVQINGRPELEEHIMTRQPSVGSEASNRESGVSLELELKLVLVYTLMIVLYFFICLRIYSEFTSNTGSVAFP